MSETIARSAAEAFRQLKTLSDEERSLALVQIHHALQRDRAHILAANERDMAAAREALLAPSLIKRLDLGLAGKYDTMLQGIIDVAQLADPVGQCTLARQLDEGLNLYRVTAPLGVLLVIFEARPEVIANITALAIKLGNAVVLKGGKELYETFKAMSECVARTLAQTSVPAAAVQLVQLRADVSGLLLQDRYIDLVIPRGSNALVRSIKENTKIPVLGHADGICSVYVDALADLAKAQRIVVDSKTNYPAGCNAAEQLLLDASLAPLLQVALVQLVVDAGVVPHVTPQVKHLLPPALQRQCVDADAAAFDTEYLLLDISVALVDGVAGAVRHINEHSSKHTDCIVAEHEPTAAAFLKGVDLAGVYWNCLTRFADGFRYGFGTEVGISTNKIHARGPVGLEGLMSYQYQLRGNGHVVGEYVGGGGQRAFVHKDIDKL